MTAPKVPHAPLEGRLRSVARAYEDVGTGRLLVEAADALAAVTTERDQARQMLADAPHDFECAMSLPRSVRIPEDFCSCWKKKL